METTEEKKVFVFKDEIAKILLCDLECKLDVLGKPCVYVCDSGKTYYGDLAPKEVEFFKSANPENFSIWLERPDGATFECVFNPSEHDWLETHFKSELLQRFKAYAAALQELGVKELELSSNEKAEETSEKGKDFNAEVSIDAPVPIGEGLSAAIGGKGRYHDGKEESWSFLQEIQKSFKIKFNKAVIVDVENLRPKLEKEGFWTDEIVQAIVRARKQGRELEHVEMKISANLSREVSNRFKMAAGLEAEVKTWQISGSAEGSQSGNIKNLSSMVQNLSVIVSTGFSSIDDKAKSKGHSVIDDAEACDVEESKVKQIAEAFEPPIKKEPDEVRCPSCGASVSATAKFCSECGSPLARKCASCGTELKPGMKFCPECGAKV